MKITDKTNEERVNYLRAGPTYRIGWQCPLCERIMAPDQSFCIFCTGKETRDPIITVTNNSGFVSYDNENPLGLDGEPVRVSSKPCKIDKKKR